MLLRKTCFTANGTGKRAQIEAWSISRWGQRLAANRKWKRVVWKPVGRQKG